MPRLTPLIFSALCVLPVAAQAHDHAAAMERCIAEQSGAPSVACLEAVFWDTQRHIARLEKTLLAGLRQQRQAGELTGTHHELAASSLVDAAKKYEAFRERQCDFALGASGAAASGAEQVRWQYRIRLNDWRIDYLTGLRDSR